MKKIHLIILLAIACSVQAFSQSPSSQIKTILGKVTAASGALETEQLYLHTDKPNYFLNDTLWFKAYLLDGFSLAASEKSGLLYFEVFDENDSLVKRQLVQLQQGIGWGDIALTERDFPIGSYTLRAYTNWMRNFGENRFFQKPFSISAVTAQDWLIHSAIKTGMQNGRLQTDVSLRFTKADGRPIAQTDMKVKLTNGRRSLLQSAVKTGADGMVDFNFYPPEEPVAKKLTLRMTPLQGTEKKEFVIPVTANSGPAMDLQFLPEGGYLVGGLMNRVAFKAIGENGLSVDVSGVIKNSRNEEIVKIRSAHLGMGSFDFLPGNGETYAASISLPGGGAKNFPLPAVRDAGVVLRVSNQLEDDSIQISVSYTPGQAAQTFYLVGQARGIACAGATIRPGVNGKRLISISKNVFPTGVARFTLLDTMKRPVCERSFFIDHHDNAKAVLTTNRPDYGKRDSVSVTVQATDATGQPVQGSFSLAVTDDNQVKIDSFQQRSLVSDMLLGAGLKGNVEEPAYYFQQPMTPEIWANLDNLLLTQGWTGYNWDLIFKETPPIFLYAAEQSYSISGKVTNMFNKPVAGSGVALIGSKPALFLDTLTNTNGTFYFNNLYPADSAVYFLQSKNKKGKSFNVGIEMNEFIAPAFHSAIGQTMPWYLDIDSGKLAGLRQRLVYQQEKEHLSGDRLLGNVIVKGKKPIRGSKNLNGPGGYDYALDEEDMEKAGKKTLGDIIREKVKHFHVSPKAPVYVISGCFLVLIIDGVDILFSYQRPGSLKDFYDNYFNYIDAEDIKGIEVMEAGGYSGRYFQSFIASKNPYADPSDFAFIEVTTRSGNGAYLKHTPGTYIFKPLRFAPADRFYSPAYPVKSDSLFADTRSAIYWNPNIVTDKKGKALVTFYTADKPGKYSLVLEGADLNGQVMGGQLKLMVK